MGTLESGIWKLNEIAKDRVLEVPEYQRFYSWEHPHLEDLWTDIQNLTAGKSHYFGTVILQGTDEVKKTEGRFPKELDAYKLIDGQQRITTVAILFRVLTDAMKDAVKDLDIENEQDKLEDRIKEIEKEFLRQEGVYKIKLLGDDREFFEKHIVERQDHPREERTPSQSRLYGAKEYFEEQIEELKASKSTVDFLHACDAICQQVSSMRTMVYVVPTDDLGRATLIFESVNDRGRDLGTLEKTKSFLMHLLYLSTQDEEEELKPRLNQVRRNFQEIYRHLLTIKESDRAGRIDEDDIQRYHYISFANWTDREHHQKPLEHLKETFRETYRSDPQECVGDILEYARSLEEAFQSFKHIVTYGHQSNGGHPRVDRYLKRIYHLGNVANFYPALIPAWPTLDNDGRVKMLKAIEHYIMRVYTVCNRRSDTGAPKLARRVRDHAWREPDGEEWANHIYDILEEYADDQAFDESLQSSSFYESRVDSEDIKYLLAFYNEQLNEEADEPGAQDPLKIVEGDFWIEHIWPQTPDGPLSAEEELEHNQYNDRLGNLTIASDKLDIQWGNKPFRKKKDDYRNSALRVQRALAEYEGWGPEQIKEREAILREFALDFWSLPGEQLQSAE